MATSDQQKLDFFSRFESHTEQLRDAILAIEDDIQRAKDLGYDLPGSVTDGDFTETELSHLTRANLVAWFGGFNDILSALEANSRDIWIKMNRIIR